MGLCFICNDKLSDKKTRICSSVLPHSNVPCTEIIAEIMGEDYVIILTPNDYLCMKCTYLFDNLERYKNDLIVTKNIIIAHIKKKYGLLSAETPNLAIGNNSVNTQHGSISTRCMYRCRFCTYQSAVIRNVWLHMESMHE